MQIPWQAPTPGEENISLWHTRLQSIFGDHDDDADHDDADHDDDYGDDEKGLEDKMGCDQTEDLDGAFVPPLSDHPCLQCRLYKPYKIISHCFSLTKLDIHSYHNTYL